MPSLSVGDFRFLHRRLAIVGERLQQRDLSVEVAG